jgi:hypothetical protein
MANGESTASLSKNENQMSTIDRVVLDPTGADQAHMNLFASIFYCSRPQHQWQSILSVHSRSALVGWQSEFRPSYFN